MPNPLLDHQARVDPMEHERQVINRRHHHWVLERRDDRRSLSGGSGPSACSNNLLAMGTAIRENVLEAKRARKIVVILRLSARGQEQRKHQPRESQQIARGLPWSIE